MSVQCEYQNNGKQCRGYAILDSRYCFAHDPASAKKRAEARKKGGLNRRVIKRTQHKYHSIKSVKDINVILESAINEASSLECSQSNLRTLAYLCQIALKGQELGSLEERVNAVEKTMSQMKEQK
ncbi:hypothetical protein ACFLXG_03195 [Chloroflexota bacterium]